MNILVTGGAGFLGSSICDRLKQDGHEVIIFDNLFRGKEENIQGFNLQKNDLTKMQYDLYLAIQKQRPEYIYHFAAINGTNNFYEKPYDVFHDNINITYNLLETIEKVIATDESYNPKVIYASTSEVYGNPEYIPTPENSKTSIRTEKDRDSYSASKLICEFYIRFFCERHGLDYLILRIFNVYGKRDIKGHVIPDMIEKIKNAKDTIEVIGSGQETRSFCYIDDFIEMIFKLINSDGWNDIYNIGNTEETSIKYLVELLEEKYGKKLIKLSTKLRDGDHSRRCPDISKLLKVIGDYKCVDLKECLDRIL